jgi:hypothetical protein
MYFLLYICNEIYWTFVARTLYRPNFVFANETVRVANTRNYLMFNIQRGARPQTTPVASGDSFRISSRSLRTIQRPRDAIQNCKSKRIFSRSNLHEKFRGDVERLARKMLESDP